MVRNLFQPLLKGFTLAKPAVLSANKDSQEIIYELERDNRLFMFHKRNGHKLVCIIGKDSWPELYDNSNRRLGDRVVHLKSEIGKLHLLPGTVFYGEAIMNTKGKDNSLLTDYVFSQLTESRALRLQKIYGYLDFRISGMLFSGDKAFIELPYQDEYLHIREMFFTGEFEHVRPEKILIGLTYNQAKELAIEKDWPGLILYDKFYQQTFKKNKDTISRPKGYYIWNNPKFR